MSVDAEKSAVDKAVGDNSSNSDVDNIVDPDAGLSEEERNAAVSNFLSTRPSNRTGERGVVFLSKPAAQTRIADIVQERKLLWKLDLQLIPWVCSSSSGKETP